AFRRAVRLADHEEFPITDEERTRTDCDRKGRDVEGHGPRHASERDGFIPGLVPRPPRWAMQRKVGFTPRGFLKRIWQLGNFDVDTGGGDAKQLTNLDDIVGEIAWRPDGQSIALSAGVGLLDYVGLVDLAGHMEKVVAFPDSENAIGGDLGRPRPWSPDGRELAFVSNVHDHVDIGVLDVKTKKVRFVVQSRWD